MRSRLTNMARRSAAVLVSVILALCTHCSDGALVNTTARVALGRTVTMADAARSMGYVVSSFPDRSVSLCSASLIADEWIVLAAHCVVKKNDMVKLGEHHKTGGPTRNYGSVHKVVSLKRHEEALTARHLSHNDIMVCKISPPACKNCAIRLNKALAFPAKNANVYAFGYGVDANLANPYVLRTAQFQTLAHWECRRLLEAQNMRRNANNIKKDMHLCANEALGAGVCNGDSGGPLVVKTRTGFVQVGISSFRIKSRTKCGDPRVPDVYTRVASYHRWIVSAIGGPSTAGFLP